MSNFKALALPQGQKLKCRIQTAHGVTVFSYLGANGMEWLIYYQVHGSNEVNDAVDGMWQLIRYSMTHEVKMLSSPYLDVDGMKWLIMHSDI